MHKNQIHLGQTKRVKEKSRNGILPLWPNGSLTFSTAHAAAVPEMSHSARQSGSHEKLFVRRRCQGCPRPKSWRREKREEEGKRDYPLSARRDSPMKAWTVFSKPPPVWRAEKMLIWPLYEWATRCILHKCVRNQLRHELSSAILLPGTFGTLEVGDARKRT